MQRVKEAISIISGSYLKTNTMKSVMLNEITENAILGINELMGIHKKGLLQVNIKKYLRSNAMIKCIPHLMETAIKNIIVNSVESIKEKGEIYITTENTDDTCYIYIQDSGPGIAPSSIDRIFEPFFSKEKGENHMGLGLSVAKAVIEDSGGSIEVITHPGEGSTFVVKLPIHIEEVERKSKITKDLSGRRVIIVDDECILNNLMGEILKSKGIDVIFCSSLMDAIRVLRRKSADLIIAESKAPEKEAERILSMIKKIDNDARVIFITDKRSFKLDKIMSELKEAVFSIPIHMDSFLNYIYGLLSSK